MIVNEDLVFSVTELSSLIQTLIENTFSYVKVRGEISNFTRASSGHIYFSLKDESSLIKGIIWKSKASSINNFSDGLEVIVTGKISSYNQSSSYNIIVSSIKISGEGTILKMIEKRKKDFTEQGFFDESIKKPLPLLPRRIGVITSTKGAVLHDIIDRISERFPLHLMVYDVNVQGNESEEMITNAIEYFNRLAKSQSPDLLILARGGGSIEDLLPFSSEKVVVAIFKSQIPIISAIGHETDYTLSDLAADKRSATPTAAAEIAVPLLSDLNKFLQIKMDKLYSSAIYKINYNKQLLEGYSFTLQNYEEKFKVQQIILNNLYIHISKQILFYCTKKSYMMDQFYLEKTKKLLVAFVNKQDMLLKQSIDRLNFVFNKIVDKFDISIKNLNNQLEFFNHEANLKRGYVIVSDVENGMIIKNKDNFKKTKEVKINFLDGSVELSVKTL